MDDEEFPEIKDESRRKEECGSGNGKLKMPRIKKKETQSERNRRRKVSQKDDDKLDAEDARDGRVRGDGSGDLARPIARKAGDLLDALKGALKHAEMKTISMLRKRNQEVGSKTIGSVDPAKRWSRLSIAVDSGACESVVDPEQVPGLKLIDTSESLASEEFQSATGEPIPNLGSIQVPMYTRESTIRGMLFTGAPVSKPLASVKKICQAGHVVWFEEGGSFILNKATGECNALREEAGNYMLDVYIPPESESGAAFARPQ